MFCDTGVVKCGSSNRYKGKINRNESYREKNRGPAYVPRFVILFPPEQKDTVYDKGDLLPIYMYGKRT